MKKPMDDPAFDQLCGKADVMQWSAQFQSLTIMIGATDEAQSLIQTVRQIFSCCRKEDVEKILIVRSKNASEGCVQASLALEQMYPGVVQSLIQSRPYVGGAIQDGFDAATTTHILLLPADLAIGLDILAQMIETAKRYPNGIVKTSRWLRRGSFHGYSKSRWLFNSCAQVFLRGLFQTKLTDMTNPVQIMPTGLYRAIRWKELNFPFLLELVLVPLRLGVSFREIAADCNERKEGTSKNSFLQTALFLRTAVRIRFTAEKNLRKDSCGL